MVGVDAEDTRDFPLFFVKRKPFLFQGQREFMSKVMDLLIQASQLDEARAAKLSSFSIGFDIASAVAKAAKSVGLLLLTTLTFPTPRCLFYIPAIAGLQCWRVCTAKSYSGIFAVRRPFLRATAKTVPKCTT